MTVDPNDPENGATRPNDPLPSSEELADEIADDVIEDLEGADDDIAAGDPFAGPTDEAETQEAMDRLRADATERGGKEDAARSFWRELPILVIVALIVAVLIKTFLVQAFYIPSSSMSGTLVVGDRVMVNKLSYVFGSPDGGDVIVFDNPSRSDGGESLLGALTRHVGESLGISSPDSALIKRVIAVGGETIEIADNQVVVDGTAIDESYLSGDIRMRKFGPLLVPDGHVFVMGDNRSPGGSSDSRGSLGTIPEENIIGRAFVKVWPPSRWSGL